MTTYNKTELSELLEEDKALLRNYQQALSRVEHISGYEMQHADLLTKIKHTEERIATYQEQLKNFEDSQP